MRKLIGGIKWALFPLFDTINQICMKYLGLTTGDMPLGLAWLQRVIVSGYWWGAIAADIGSFLMWMLILRRSHLSFAAPFISMQYVTILLASHFLFHEPIHLPHAIGVLLIITGLVLVGAGPSREDD